MSNSALLNSSIAKKWWMALTGLFLCLFLVGHLLGNLQLIFIHGEEGKRAFNEYAYFMTHNPFIKVLSYVTYFSILFHAIDGLVLTFKNKKARPKNYAYNKPGTNSSLPSRYMAVLGTAILVFIVLHMASFWGKMHYTAMPLHTVNVENTEFYLTQTEGSYIPVVDFEQNDLGEAKFWIKDGTEFYTTRGEIKLGEGYKDLHSLVFAYFGHDKMEEANLPANKNALIAVIIYVVAMLVLAFHLWHGFASGFQTLGVNHSRYNSFIKGFGKFFAIVVPLAFAIIPIMIFMNK